MFIPKDDMGCHFTPNSKDIHPNLVIFNKYKFRMHSNDEKLVSSNSRKK